MLWYQGVRSIRWVWLGCVVGAASAGAGPPLLTDDPDTPGPNNWEINNAIVSEHAEHQWNIGAPLLDMNYGVGYHLQLKYQVQYNINVPEHGGPSSGMGDSLAGIKWRFIDQTTNGSWLEVSTYPQVEFIYPSSSIWRGLGDKGDNLLLPIEIEHSFESVVVYAEAGYIWNEFKPYSVWYGLAGEWDLTKNFALMGEFYGGFDHRFENSGLSFNLGFSQILTDHLALIGAFGRGIYGAQERAPDFQSYLGLRVTF